MSKHTALIDGDIIAYRTGFAVEQKIINEEVIDGETWSTKTYEVEPLENALQIVKDTIDMILFELGTDQFEVYLTGDSNFRKELATVREYKGNRKNARKPIHIGDIRKYLISEYGAKVSEGQEADDDLGVRLTELGEQGVICSIDKDLLMVPGKHFNWVNGKKKVTNNDHANQYFYRQLLKGDATDNIPGCPGIGDKRAAKALTGVTDVRQLSTVVEDLYHQQMEKYSHKIISDMVYKDGKVCYNHWQSGEDRVIPLREYITEIGNLLWIRRYPDQKWEFPE